VHSPGLIGRACGGGGFWCFFVLFIGTHDPTTFRVPLPQLRRGLVSIVGISFPYLPLRQLSLWCFGGGFVCYIFPPFFSLEYLGEPCSPPLIKLSFVALGFFVGHVFCL